MPTKIKKGKHLWWERAFKNGIGRELLWRFQHFWVGTGFSSSSEFVLVRVSLKNGDLRNKPIEVGNNNSYIALKRKHGRETSRKIILNYSFLGRLSFRSLKMGNNFNSNGQVSSEVSIYVGVFCAWRLCWACAVNRWTKPLRPPFLSQWELGPKHPEGEVSPSECFVVLSAASKCVI